MTLNFLLKILEFYNYASPSLCKKNEGPLMRKGTLGKRLSLHEVNKQGEEILGLCFSYTDASGPTCLQITLLMLMEKTFLMLCRINANCVQWNYIR